MINDVTFIELLAKIQKHEASSEVEDDFYQKYIDPVPLTIEDFEKIKYAAEHGYLKAYESLGRAYLTGTGCEAKPECGIEWLKKAIEKNKRGAYLLGDFYRNGSGVQKDFEQAYYWYDVATQIKDIGIKRADDFNPENLLLRCFDSAGLDFQNIETAWWDFVAMKEEPKDPVILEALRKLYDPVKNSVRYWFWTKRAAEAGSLWAKFDYGKRLLNDHDESSLNQAISLLNVVARSGYSDVNAEAAMELILSSGSPEEVKHDLLVWALNNGYDGIARSHFKNHGREALFDAWADTWYDFEEEEQEEISSDSFRCTCCHKVYALDDQSNPDLQGYVCDECYNTGKIFE